MNIGKLVNNSSKLSILYLIVLFLLLIVLTAVFLFFLKAAYLFLFFSGDPFLENIKSLVIIYFLQNFLPL